MKTPLLFVAIVLSTVMFLHIPPAAGEDSAYLKVWTDRQEADTYSFFTIYVESKIWVVNATGNASLMPNNSTFDLTVLSLDDNLTVARISDWPLMNGGARLPIQVGPEWTDSLIEITVFEHRTGMNASTRIQTRMSDEYMVWLIDNAWFKRFNDYQAMVDSQAASDATWKGIAAIVISALSFVFWLAVFLRMEHRLASNQNRDSLWDRFIQWFPLTRISFAETDEDVWLDPEKTWDKPAAQFYSGSRRKAAARNIDAEIEILRKEKIKVMGDTDAEV